MDFASLIAARRSIRVFRKAPVDQKKLKAILEAVDAAPSAGDLQAFEVVAVTKPAVREALAAAARGQEPVSHAPVVLVFFANPARNSARYGKRVPDLYAVQDATIACAFAHLRAADLGLGSVWVGAFDDEAVRKAVHAPKELLPVALLPIGHPDEKPEPTPRRGVKSLVRKERFQDQANAEKAVTQRG